MNTVIKESFVHWSRPLLLEEKVVLHRGALSVMLTLFELEKVWQLQLHQILQLEQFGCLFCEIEYQLCFFIIIFEII